MGEKIEYDIHMYEWPYEYQGEFYYLSKTST